MFIYRYGAIPLFPSTKSRELNYQPLACGHCKSPRTFIIQVMPQIITHLKGIAALKMVYDWDTILIYTCSMNCSSAEKQYTNESSLKLVFSTEGLGDALRKGMINSIRKEQSKGVVPVASSLAPRMVDLSKLHLETIEETLEE